MREVMIGLIEMNAQLFREAALVTIDGNKQDPAFLSFLLRQLFEGFVLEVPTLSHVEAVEVQNGVFVLRNGNVVDASKLLQIDGNKVLSLQSTVGK